MRPDVITTLREEYLLRPRDIRPNADVLLKPFGKYAKFLVRTGLAVRERSRGDAWTVSSLAEFSGVARWLSRIQPTSAVLMTDVTHRIVAVHRAAPGFEDAAERVIVLSSLTGAGHCFLAESTMESAPMEDARTADSLREARRRILCTPIGVVDMFAVGRKQFAASLDDWEERDIWPSISSKHEQASIDRLENEFDARVILARSARWSGKPGPMFSERLLHDACEHLKHDDQENMVVFAFGEGRRLLAIYEAARGAADHVATGARDLLKVPILVGASEVAIIHNHPSGIATPSPDDYEMARKFLAMAACVGIHLIGSFVIGRETGITGFMVTA
jgi:hypothetical protein